MEETKIIIEITAKGWTTKVHQNNKVYEEKHIATSSGATSVGGTFMDEDDISENLCDAMCGLSSYDVMNALQNEY